MESFYKRPGLIVALVLLFTLVTGSFIPRLKVTFDFEQFFPENDADLEYYKKFTAEFEKDDNFLLISLANVNQSIFDTSFLHKVRAVTDTLFSVKNIDKVQSLTNFKIPVKTPFGYTLIPALHIHDHTKLQEDKLKIENDERFIGSFINEQKTAIAIFIKTADNLDFEQSDTLIQTIKSIIKANQFEEGDYHILGQAFFQTELVGLQKEEIIISTLVSAVLVFIILYLIFGKLLTAGIAMMGIGCSLAIFMGILAITGRSLSVMAALYPVLILIVGCSDVIHLISKYLDHDITEENKLHVMKTVIKEVGLATFITSATTAIGFVTLSTSQLTVIRSFGMSAGLGVMIAYAVVMLLVPSLLLLFTKGQLYKKSVSGNKIQTIAWSAYTTGVYHKKYIISGFSILVIICLIGLSKVTTDYKLIDNLPFDEKVTKDFLYFEKEFAGFRPFEIAIYTNPPFKVNDFEIVKMIAKIENKLQSYSAIKSTISVATIFKSLNMLENGNQKSAYTIPDSLEAFTPLLPLFQKASKNEFNVLVNKNNTATRISCKITDIGADNVKILNNDFEKWVKQNVDASKLEVKRTGTTLVLDKNSDYVIKNIFQGLLLSIVLISLLMALIVKNLKMLLVSLIPNLIPLLFAAALLGFFGIPLDAGISIVFAVIFGIAVDDTIHFIARYNQCMANGATVEQSLSQTFKDTGKALIITTIILFFGFLVMLFSKHPASIKVGVLISFTLITALICDLYLLPVLIRKYFIAKIR